MDIQYVIQKPEWLLEFKNIDNFYSKVLIQNTLHIYNALRTKQIPLIKKLKQ